MKTTARFPFLLTTLLFGADAAAGDSCGTISEVASIEETLPFGFDVHDSVLAIYRESIGSIDLYDARSLPAFDLLGSIDVSDLPGYSSVPAGSPLSLDGDRVYLRLDDETYVWDIADPSAPEPLAQFSGLGGVGVVLNGVQYEVQVDDDVWIFSAADVAETGEVTREFGLPNLVGSYALHAEDGFVVVGGAGLDIRQSEPASALLGEPIASVPFDADDIAAHRGVGVVLESGSLTSWRVIDFTDPFAPSVQGGFEAGAPIFPGGADARRGVAAVPLSFQFGGIGLWSLESGEAVPLATIATSFAAQVRLVNGYLISGQAEGNGLPARFAVFDLQGCGPCAADLALPFRALDLADIGAFVSGFIGLDARSDLTGDGVWDLGDIQAFVASFNAGC